MIHETAVISPGATLGKNVSVGRGKNILWSDRGLVHKAVCKGVPKGVLKGASKGVPKGVPEEVPKGAFKAMAAKAAKPIVAARPSQISWVLAVRVRASLVPDLRSFIQVSFPQCFTVYSSLSSLALAISMTNISRFMVDSIYL